MLWFLKKNEVSPVVSSNILITNYCNQSCPFCFAGELMGTGRAREMSLVDFKKTLDFLSKNRVNNISILGGEPTLHSNFKEIINLAINKGFQIDIFTNALFSKEIGIFLREKVKKINMFHINVATPAYKLQKNFKKINEFIADVSAYSNVSLETTIGSSDKEDLLSVFKVAEPILKDVYARIGVDGALVNRGGFSLVKNRQIGQIILFLEKRLFDKGIKGLWLSEINPCMFTDDELFELKNNSKVSWKGYACFSKNGGIDVKTDLKIIRCFGQECLKGQNVGGNSLEKIEDDLKEEMIKIGKKTLPIECSVCKYYGYEKDQCPGPCLIGRT